MIQNKRTVLLIAVFLLMAITGAGCQNHKTPLPATHPPLIEVSRTVVIQATATRSEIGEPVTLPDLLANISTGAANGTPMPTAYVTAEVISPALSPATITAVPPTQIPPTQMPPTQETAVIAQPLPVEHVGQSAVIFPKIGFHTGSGGGDTRGLGDWMREMDAAGIPFFLKSADTAGALYEAQELMRASGVPHILVYRRVGGDFELPDYSMNPVAAARKHWELQIEAWPPELDPSIVWMESVNEPDKERSEWLAVFAQETARLAVRDGRRWAAFGWATGEPEPDDWEGPEMLAFLRYAGEHPEQIAVAIHEYSLTTEAIDADYPYLVGRFQWLFAICDENNIPRPTVLITEWGWEYQRVPDVETALAHIAWANDLYGRFPEVLGAAIWYLGPGWGGISVQTQKLIEPVAAASKLPLTNVADDRIAKYELFAKYYLENEYEPSTE